MASFFIFRKLGGGDSRRAAQFSASFIRRPPKRSCQPTSCLSRQTKVERANEASRCGHDLLLLGQSSFKFSLGRHHPTARNKFAWRLKNCFATAILAPPNLTLDSNSLANEKLPTKLARQLTFAAIVADRWPENQSAGAVAGAAVSPPLALVSGATWPTLKSYYRRQLLRNWRRSVGRSSSS